MSIKLNFLDGRLLKFNLTIFTFQYKNIKRRHIRTQSIMILIEVLQEFDFKYVLSMSRKAFKFCTRV